MRILISASLCITLSLSAMAQDHTITRTELLDRMQAFWIGQLVGNYMGFPFENVYVDEPVPVLVDRYYTWQDASDTLRMNHNDHRSFVPILLGAFEGSYSDDDTDIEFVTLHAVEQHGLDLTYEEITDMWKAHINRKIWVANRTARNLMDEGLTAPHTGSMEHNEHWFQIDPQLVNEIWSVFYPGMAGSAAERAEWAARITNDDWGTHPTIAYAVMISHAFFENDPKALVRNARAYIPADSPFYEGMVDVVRWHSENPDDWRKTRQLIHDKYYRYTTDDYEAPVSVVSSLVNGLCGVMALLYGEGDFVRTVGLGVSAGYDCDNQAATLGGLLGVMHGMSAIPEHLTHGDLAGMRWSEPFNNLYVNYSRDGLPNAVRITDLAERMAAIAEQAILQNGGSKETIDGEVVYTILCDC